MGPEKRGCFFCVHQMMVSAWDRFSEPRTEWKPCPSLLAISISIQIWFIIFFLKLKKRNSTCSDEHYSQCSLALAHKHPHDSARIRHDRGRQRGRGVLNTSSDASLRRLRKAASEWPAPLLETTWGRCHFLGLGRECGESDDGGIGGGQGGGGCRHRGLCPRRILFVTLTEWWEGSIEKKTTKKVSLAQANTFVSLVLSNYQKKNSGNRVRI